MLEIIKIGSKFLRVIIPLGAMFMIIIFAGSIFGWWNKFNRSLKEIFSNPSRFFFGLVIIVIMVVFFFKYIWPYLDKILK